MGRGCLPITQKLNARAVSSWVVTDVFVLMYPQHSTESVIQVKQGNLKFALYFSQEGGLLHERDITDGDDTNWPPMG